MMRHILNPARRGTGIARRTTAGLRRCATRKNKGAYHRRRRLGGIIVGLDVNSAIIHRPRPV